MPGVEPAVLALLWAVGLTRLARSRPSQHHRVITLSILAIAFAATVHDRVVALALDRVIGVPDISVLLRTLSGIAAVVALWAFASAVTRPHLPRPYLRPRLYLAGIAVMTGLTALFALIDRAPGPGWFGEEQPHSPLVILYGLASNSLFGVGAGRAVVLFWAQARTTGQALLRRGLLVLCAAGLTALAYVWLRVLCLLMHALRVHPLGGLLDGPGFAATTRGLLSLTLFLFAVGCVLPGLGVLRDYTADYTALVRLYRLWHTLQTAVPGLVLGSAPSRLGDLLNPFNVRMRLYRRLIEIRDAQWGLGAPADPDPTSEAAMLVMALSTVLSGSGRAQPRRHPRPPRTRRPFRRERDAGLLDREVTHLLHVAEYFESVVGPVPMRQTPQPPPVEPSPRARLAGARLGRAGRRLRRTRVVTVRDVP